MNKQDKETRCKTYVRWTVFKPLVLFVLAGVDIYEHVTQAPTHHL